MTHVKQAFEQNIVSVPLEQILPTRKLDREIQTSKKYQTILSSIREFGNRIMHYVAFQTSVTRPSNMRL